MRETLCVILIKEETLFKITISSEILTNDHINAINDFFYGDKFIQLISELNISSLEEIVITNDFEYFLRRTSEKYNLEYSGFTNNNHAIAIGKVLHSKFEEDNFRQTVFYNDNFIMGLFNIEKANYTFHYIYHELCHIDDHDIQRKIFSYKARKELQKDSLKNYLYNCAHNIWSEYVVVRKSCITVSKEDVLDLIHLNTTLNIITDIEKEISDEIISYRLHGNIIKLFNLVYEKSDLILRYFVYSIAYFDGLGIYEKCNDVLNDIYDKTVLKDNWICIHKNLNNLYDTYPNWNDIYELEVLCEGINLVWNDLGIFPRTEDGEGFYIAVP